MTTEERSPLHPNALTRADLVPHLQIIRFHTRQGIKGEYVIINVPLMGDGMVELYDTQVECTEQFMLSDMGIISRKSGWSETNFTIAATDRHLLPQPIPYEDRR